MNRPKVGDVVVVTQSGFIRSPVGTLGLITAKNTGRPMLWPYQIKYNDKEYGDMMFKISEFEVIGEL